MPRTILFPRWQEVVERCLPIAQEDDGIGELRAPQIPLNQARMAWVVFHQH
jgi:hypothetical protein